MGLFSANRQPGESADDFQWRDAAREAADTVCEAGNARQRGDHARAADRAEAAEEYINQAARIRRRG